MPRLDQKAWATAAVAIFTVAALTWLAYQAFLGGRAIDLTVGDSTIVISGEEDFRDVFRRAVAEDRVAVSDAVRERGFYHLASADLMRTIRAYKMPPELLNLVSEEEVQEASRAFDSYAAAFLTDPLVDLDEVADATEREAEQERNRALMAAARDAAKSMRDQLLSMVGSLAGPFQTPGTLRHSNQQFKEALRDLYAAMDETRSAGPLLTWLWLSSIDAQDIFQPKNFRAVVRRAAPRASDSGAVLFGCPDNPFRGREVQLVAPNGVGVLVARIEDEPGRVTCTGDGPDLSEMLANQPVQLAIGEAAARRLFGPEGFQSPVAQEVMRMQPGPEDPEAFWIFRVLPRLYQPREGAPEVAISDQATEVR